MSTTASRLTAEQSRAIETRDVSIALSAGAGCGKTFVLTERFLDHFNPHDAKGLRPDEIGQLIAITFTDRAAREMRDRIRRKCYERLLADAADEKAAQYWSSLLRSLDAARVSTIHSFCGSLLRSHAVEAGLDPQFGVLEQTEADTLLSELIDDTLRQLLADRDDATLDVLVAFSLDGLRAMILTLVRSRERVHYAAWLDRSPEELADCWAEFHRRQVVPAVLCRIAASPAAIALLEVARGEISTNATMRERQQTIVRVLTAWREDPPRTRDPAGELAELREAAKVQGGGGKKDWRSDDVKAAFQTAATQLRDLIDRVSETLAFDRDASLPVAHASLQVLSVAQRVCQTYADRKRDLGRLDFDDLLTSAHRLLTDPANERLQQQLSGQVRLLLVDEFQDTDPLQVELVEALCGDSLARGKLFFVGDHKQSIYRFRGADPRVFRGLRERTPAKGRLPLTRNFRSQPAILNFVNALFRNELTDEYDQLLPDRPQVGPEPAVEFLWAPCAPADESQENAEQMREREANWVARRLRTLLDEGRPIVFDRSVAGEGPPARKPEPRDIAILFRALSNVSIYEKALQTYGIPYYLVGGHAFYAQQEIFDLVNLLRSIASAADALSLVGVLRSPFFSLSDETLFWLAQQEGGVPGGLLSAKLPAQVRGEDATKVCFARETLSHLRSIKDQVPVAQLINTALELTGYDAALLGEFLGERKLANLRKLVDQARSFDRSGLFSLNDFIQQVALFVAEQPDEPLAATHPEATNVVRLMTIHQSKGLEFPIVVVPDLERPAQGDRQRVCFTPALGPMVKLPARNAAETPPVGGLELYRAATRDDDEQEMRRLLYVATTRAADFLILSSSVKELGKPSGPWTELLARHFELPTGRLVDALPDGWGMPQVGVTSTEPVTTVKPEHGKSHRDLAKLVAGARALAQDGKGLVPPHVAAIPVDQASRRQFSFSRLTGALKHDEPEQSVAAESDYVLATPIVDPLGLGTLVHAVLADIEFAPRDKIRRSVNVRRLVDRHAERHVEDPRGELEDAVEMLDRLLDSPLVDRLAAARTSYAELEFLLGWPPGGFADGGPYLRGFIDRLWQDAGGEWHVLDFKTNQVSPGNLDSTAAKYEMQMLVYALAVEQIFGSAPRSLTLYFLRTGQEYPFTWSPAARQRVVRMVSEAISKAQRPATS